MCRRDRRGGVGRGAARSACRRCRAARRAGDRRRRRRSSTRSRSGSRSTVAVGDFDSVVAGGGRRGRGGAARAIERHPADKDATDLELALDAALALEPGADPRPRGRRRPARPPARDRCSCSADERYAGAEIDAFVGDARVHVVRGERALDGRARRARHAARAARPGGGRHDRGARVPAARARRSSRARAAASRTSSPARAHASRSSAACCSPIRPARRRGAM